MEVGAFNQLEHLCIVAPNVPPFTSWLFHYQYNYSMLSLSFFVSVNCSLFPCSASFLAVWLAVQRCQLLGSLEEFILALELHACYQSSLYSSYDSCSCCIEQNWENMTDLITEKISGVCVCCVWWWRRLSILISVYFNPVWEYSLFKHTSKETLRKWISQKMSGLCLTWKTKGETDLKDKDEIILQKNQPFFDD